MYKITFGILNANRGIEYASQINCDVIRGLWGHPADVKDIGNNCYHLTSDEITENPLLVTCEYLDIDLK